MRLFTVIILLVVAGVSSCKKTEELKTPTINDYYPLAVGKSITYNLDSSIFINFGQKDTVVHYQAQDVVDAQVTDNVGRPAFRVIRSLRRTPSDAWQINSSYLVVPTQASLEVVEDNNRFIKLRLPVRDGFSWKGNSYVNTSDDLSFMDNWDYTYDSTNVPLTLGSLSFDSTLKVAQHDEFAGQDPSIPGTVYGEQIFAEEKYAKGVGLIYKNFVHWTYQGSCGCYDGYGLKLTIIDHN
jgi:hypothetical protein